MDDDPLLQAAAGASMASDYLTLERYAREILARSERTGDRRDLAWGNFYLGSAQFQRNDGRGAERAYRCALDLFTELGDEIDVARCMIALGAVAMDVHLDADEARQLYDRAVPIVRRSGDRNRLAVALGNLSEICRNEGSLKRALAYAAEALDIFTELGERTNAGWVLSDMAHYHALLRDFPTAIATLRRAYEELAYESNPRWVAWYFDICFIVAAQLENWEIAASLLGFTDHYRDANRVPRMQALLPWFSGPVERLFAQTGTQERLSDLRTAGEALTIDEASRLAESIGIPS